MRLEVSAVCPAPGGLGRSLPIGVILNHKVNIPADGNLVGRRRPSACVLHLGDCAGAQLGVLQNDVMG